MYEAVCSQSKKCAAEDVEVTDGSRWVKGVKLVSYDYYDNLKICISQFPTPHVRFKLPSRTVN